MIAAKFLTIVLMFILTSTKVVLLYVFRNICVQIIAFSKQNYKNILAILHQSHNFQFFTNTKEIHSCVKMEFIFG